MRSINGSRRSRAPRISRRPIVTYIAAAIAISLSLAGAAVSAGAQSPLSLGVGAGVTMPRDDLGARTDRGYHGMVTLRLGVPLVPIHLRGDVMHGRLDGAPGGTGDLQVTSASLSVGYDVLPLAVVSVYAIAGAGYYWTKLDNPGGDRERHGGWNAGAGVRLSLGSLQLFGEARYHAINVESGDAHMVPVTVGIMF